MTTTLCRTDSDKQKRRSKKGGTDAAVEAVDAAVVEAVEGKRKERYKKAFSISNEYKWPA